VSHHGNRCNLSARRCESGAEHPIVLFSQRLEGSRRPLGRQGSPHIIHVLDDPCGFCFANVLLADGIDQLPLRRPTFFPPAVTRSCGPTVQRSSREPVVHMRRVSKTVPPGGRREVPRFAAGCSADHTSKKSGARTGRSVACAPEPLTIGIR
jgi:hypothetical protein